MGLGFDLYSELNREREQGNERDRNDRDYDGHHDGDHDMVIDISRHRDPYPNRDRKLRSFPHLDDDRSHSPMQTDDDDDEETIDEDDYKGIAQRNAEDDTPSMENKTDAVIHHEGAKPSMVIMKSNSSSAQISDKGTAEMDSIFL